MRQKAQAVDIDTAALMMNEGWTPPAGIAMLKSPHRQQQWRSNNEHLNTDAGRACANAQRLRAKSASYRLELVSTEHTVRANLTEKVLPEKLATLLKQISDLKKELESVAQSQLDLEAARKSVEESIDAKVHITLHVEYDLMLDMQIKPLSLAQSRLQVRQAKPTAENVRDHAGDTS